MERVFKPQILFHESKSGSAGVVTLDDQTLENMTETANVEIKFDFTLADDVESDGNVRFVNRDQVLEDISELINTDVYFRKPIITAPQYNYTLYGGSFRASPFESLVSGCQHVKTIWEFSEDGTFSRGVERVEVTEGDLTRYDALFDRMVIDSYVRCTYVGRTSTGEKSITSNVRVFSARNQVESDYLQLVTTIERADISKGICTIPKIILNMGWISTESECNESHLSRFFSLFEKYDNKAMTLTKRNVDGLSINKISHSFWLSTENHQHKYKLVPPTSSYNNAVFRVNDQDKGYYIQEDHSEVSVNDFSGILSFRCVLVDFKNQILTSLGVSDDVKTRYGLYIFKNDRVCPEDSTFFSILPRPGTNEYNIINTLSSSVNGTTLPGGCDVVTEYYKLKDIARNNYSVYFRDITTNQSVHEDFLLNKKTVDVDLIVFGENIANVDIKLDTRPGLQISSHVVTITKITELRDNIIRVRFDITPKDDGLGKNWGCIEDIPLIVELSVENGTKHSFNYSYRVGFIYQQTQDDVSFICVSYQDSDGLPNYKIITSDDATMRDSIGYAFCPALKNQYTVSHMAIEVDETYYNLVLGGIVKFNGILVRSPYYNQDGLSNPQQIQLTNVHGRPLRDLNNSKLSNLITSTYPNKYFIMVDFGDRFIIPNDQSNKFYINTTPSPSLVSPGKGIPYLGCFLYQNITPSSGVQYTTLPEPPNNTGYYCYTLLNLKAVIDKILLVTYNGTNVTTTEEIYNYDKATNNVTVNKFINYEDTSIYPAMNSEGSKVLQVEISLYNVCESCGTDHKITLNNGAVDICEYGDSVRLGELFGRELGDGTRYLTLSGPANTWSREKQKIVINTALKTTSAIEQFSLPANNTSNTAIYSLNNMFKIVGRAYFGKYGTSFVNNGHFAFAFSTGLGGNGHTVSSTKIFRSTALIGTNLTSGLFGCLLLEEGPLPLSLTKSYSSTPKHFKDYIAESARLNGLEELGNFVMDVEDFVKFIRNPEDNGCYWESGRSLIEENTNRFSQWMHLSNVYSMLGNRQTVNDSEAILNIAKTNANVNVSYYGTDNGNTLYPDMIVEGSTVNLSPGDVSSGFIPPQEDQLFIITFGSNPLSKHVTPGHQMVGAYMKYDRGLIFRYSPGLVNFTSTNSSDILSKMSKYSSFRQITPGTQHSYRINDFFGYRNRSLGIFGNSVDYTNNIDTCRYKLEFLNPSRKIHYVRPTVDNTPYGKFSHSRADTQWGRNNELSRLFLSKASELGFSSSITGNNSIRSFTMSVPDFTRFIGNINDGTLASCIFRNASSDLNNTLKLLNNGYPVKRILIGYNNKDGNSSSQDIYKRIILYLMDANGGILREVVYDDINQLSLIRFFSKKISGGTYTVQSLLRENEKYSMVIYTGNNYYIKNDTGANDDRIKQSYPSYVNISPMYMSMYDLTRSRGNHLEASKLKNFLFDGSYIIGEIEFDDDSTVWVQFGTSALSTEGVSSLKDDLYITLNSSSSTTSPDKTINFKPKNSDTILGTIDDFIKRPQLYSQDRFGVELLGKFSLDVDQFASHMIRGISTSDVINYFTNPPAEISKYKRSVIIPVRFYHGSDSSKSNRIMVSIIDKNPSYYSSTAGDYYNGVPGVVEDNCLEISIVNEGYTSASGDSAIFSKVIGKITGDYSRIFLLKPSSIDLGITPRSNKGRIGYFNNNIFSNILYHSSIDSEDGVLEKLKREGLSSLEISNDNDRGLILTAGDEWKDWFNPHPTEGYDNFFALELIYFSLEE